MMNSAALTAIENGPTVRETPPATRNGRKSPTSAPFRFTNYVVEEEAAYRQAELFYLQKQIHSQTPMVIVLADGDKIEGVIEWYDLRTLKVRGREKVLIYKSAIKYMYKVGEVGQ